MHDPISPWLRARGAPSWVPVVLHGALLALAVWGLWAAWGLIGRPWENEAFGFWGAWKDGVLYDSTWLTPHVYVYSPVLAQIAYPLTLLPWPRFSDVWALMQLSALILMIGPIWAAGTIWLGPWLALPPTNAAYLTLRNGNPMILLALIVVAAYRWPALWALAILMKVTPGVGLVWYLVRGEWRNLGIALGATVALAGVSFAFAPQLWFDWFDLLRDAAGRNPEGVELISVPLWIRGLAAVALIAWGGRTDRYWTVPIGVMLALPAIAIGGFAVGLGALAFLRLPWIPRFWASTGASRSPKAEQVAQPAR